MDTVLNFQNVDPRTQPMFLGASLGLERFDKLKYPVFYKLAKNMQSFKWQAEEVSMLKDRGDYKLMSPTEQFVFDSNLKWQTATDSLLERSLSLLSHYVSLNELKACFAEWAYFESRIHSDSYTHILKGVYPSETVFWDSILSDPEIRHRMESIKASYDALLVDDSVDIKQKIFTAVVNTNAVEGVSFYTSFACSFFYAAVLGKMEGNAKIIKLIERDEALHVAVSTNILKYFRDVPEEGFQEIYEANKDFIVDTFAMVAETEKAWANYLFSRGNLLGLNAEILHKYIEYLTNRRLKSLDLPTIYPNQKVNPLGSWYEQYQDGSKVQVAPQETEITSYVIGSRDTEIDLNQIEDFEL